MTEIDPDAETTEDANTSKSFGENMKDAAHDLKEDAKDAVRRDSGDDDEGSSSDDDDEPDGDETSGG